MDDHAGGHRYGARDRSPGGAARRFLLASQPGGNQLLSVSAADCRFAGYQFLGRGLDLVGENAWGVAILEIAAVTVRSALHANEIKAGWRDASPPGRSTDQLPRHTLPTQAYIHPDDHDARYDHALSAGTGAVSRRR